jgi:sugar phosphate isomerase/epimerase
MRIGLSSATFYPSVNTEDSIEIMSKLGYECGEVFLNSICEYEEDFVKRIVENKERYKFDVISVHAFGSVFEPYLFDRYERRRKDLIKFFRAVCKAAALLGAKYYTFHGMRLEKYSDINKTFIVDIYNELSYIASEEGIMLSQENVSWCMSALPDFLKMIKSECKYPLGFTLDIKQSYKANISPDVYIDIMKNNLVNIHINDRDNANPCLLPGKGSVDYKSLLTGLKSIGYKGDGIIEVYSTNYNSLEELRDARNFVEAFVKSVCI